MLDSFRKGQRWLTLIFVSVIGLVFVFFLGVGGTFGPATPTGNAIVQLDEIRLTQRDLAREKTNTEARLRAELGDAYEQLDADRFLDSQALSALVNNLVLSTAASDMGLHVTKDEIRRVVQSSSGFIDEEGRFSPEAFDRFAQYNYGSQRAFIQAFTRDLLGQKLVQLLIGQTTVSDAEIDIQTRYELEELRLAYVHLDTTRLPAQAALEPLTDEEVKAYSAQHEDQLRALYAEREETLAQPERVHARHILALVAPDAADEEVAEARRRIEAARERIVAGEDFATVAEEVSQDVGSASKGGDLGTFARGDNDPALDEAAFALEAGGLSPVVRSTYGFHLIQVEERLDAETPSFEGARLMLAREAANSARALERADRLSAELAAAVEAGQSLEDAARAAGVDVARTPSLKRRPDGYVPGLGAAEDLLTTAFTLEAGESSPVIFDVEDQRVLIQVLEHERPSADTIAQERLSRRTRALSQKQNLVLQSWLDDYRSKLERSGRLLVNAELALGT